MLTTLSEHFLIAAVHWLAPPVGPIKKPRYLAELHMIRFSQCGTNRRSHALTISTFQFESLETVGTNMLFFGFSFRFEAASKSWKILTIRHSSSSRLRAMPISSAQVRTTVLDNFLLKDQSSGSMTKTNKVPLRGHPCNTPETIINRKTMTTPDCPKALLPVYKLRQ